MIPESIHKPTSGNVLLGSTKPRKYKVAKMSQLDASFWEKTSPVPMVDFS